MKQPNFSGVGVAIVTPFHKHGTVDFTSLGKVIDYIIENGVDYIVALGTTGETATLTAQEKEAVKNFIIDQTDSRVPIVLGIGGNNTLETVDKIRNTNFDGISGILSVSPYYNKPQQKGIFLHYKNISETSPVPIIMYNVPGRTCSNITAETTLQIASELPNIVATKEASGNMTQIMEVIRNKPAGFSVISGDDSLTLPIMALGGVGVISVTANAFPKQFVELVKLCKSGKFKDATAIHYKLLPIMNTLFEEGSPSGVKAALETLNLCGNNPRLPLVKISKQLHNKMNSLIQEIIEMN